jgi:hypothetical protein
MSDLMPKGGKAVMSSTEKFISEHPKLILIITIPIYSLLSFLGFRKAKLNYSEHLVLNSNRVIVELIMGLLISVVTIFYTDTKVIVFLLMVLVWF